MILDNLDVRSLLSCRRVSKWWNKKASSVIKEKPAWITVDSVCSRFNELYKCVSKSEDFPFRGLHITWAEIGRKGSSNANLQVQRYLTKFGKLHTHLRLDTMFCKNTGQLLSSLPTVKFLQVQGLAHEYEGQIDPLCMPALRTVSFKGFWGGP